MPVIAALFDCDGTLYSAQFGRGLMKYASEHGRRASVRLYFASVLIPYVLHQLRLIPEENFRRPVTARLAWLFRGLDEAQGRAMFEWVTDHYLLPTQRPDVLARLREHQAQGHSAVLVSAGFLPSLELIAQAFGVSGCVGTQIELRQGRYTGRILPPVMMGRDKDHSTREFFAARGMQVDWPASYAYADSLTDLGLLGLVGRPVAVYPEAKLHALAQSKKWDIIGAPRL